MNTDDGYQVHVVNRTLDLGEELHQREKSGVTELADELDLSKSIVHNHLNTLESRGYVLNDEGTYKPSLKLLDLGERQRKRFTIYRDGRAGEVRVPVPGPRPGRRQS